MSSTLTRWCAAVVALSALVASATVIVFEPLDTMARKVPVIVRGRVTRVVSGWDDHKKRIWTWTELAVTESVKGKTSGVVLFKQPGGEIDGVGQRVEGVAQFKEGEDCVVLLDKASDEPGTFRVYGMTAGKISFAMHQGQPAALRNLEGLTFATPTGQPVERVASPEFLGSPDQFMARLREMTGGAK